MVVHGRRGARNGFVPDRASRSRKPAQAATVLFELA